VGVVLEESLVASLLLELLERAHGEAHKLVVALLLLRVEVERADLDDAGRQGDNATAYASKNAKIAVMAVL